ncbi:MAG TPA: GNAT family N-acetyltransferase [Baekduia sp.]|nr:GNAT family N-acetyltransferase [Baekduia sp.]
MLRIETIPSDQPPATDLVDAMVAEVSEMYGPINVPGAPTATPADLGPPGGAFVVVFEDGNGGDGDGGGRAVAGGGLKRLDDEACEIKRMYVVPDARGRGLAKVLLEALEAEARRLGYRIARLDTGAQQPAAQRMYERAGYQPIGNFNANPFASFWGEKAL